MRTWDTSIIFRLLAVIAGAVMTVIGLIAVAQISWGDSFDAAPVDVGGIPFTPAVAVATAAAGVIAVIAGALHDRASKLVVGALLVCAGVVVLFTDTINNQDWVFEDGHGWLAIGVGVTLLVAAALMQVAWDSTDRRVDRGQYHHDEPLASQS